MTLIIMIFFSCLLIFAGIGFLTVKIVRGRQAHLLTTRVQQALDATLPKPRPDWRKEKIRRLVHEKARLVLSAFATYANVRQRYAQAEKAFSECSRAVNRLEGRLGDLKSSDSDQDLPALIEEVAKAHLERLNAETTWQDVDLEVRQAGTAFNAARSKLTPMMSGTLNYDPGTTSLKRLVEDICNKTKYSVNSPDTPTAKKRLKRRDKYQWGALASRIFPLVNDTLKQIQEMRQLASRLKEFHKSSGEIWQELLQQSLPESPLQMTSVQSDAYLASLKTQSDQAIETAKGYQRDLVAYETLYHDVDSYHSSKRDAQRLLSGNLPDVIDLDTARIKALASANEAIDKLIGNRAEFQIPTYRGSNVLDSVWEKTLVDCRDQCMHLIRFAVGRYPASPALEDQSAKLTEELKQAQLNCLWSSLDWSNGEASGNLAAHFNEQANRIGDLALKLSAALELFKADCQSFCAAVDQMKKALADPIFDNVAGSFTTAPLMPLVDLLKSKRETYRQRFLAMQNVAASAQSAVELGQVWMVKALAVCPQVSALAKKMEMIRTALLNTVAVPLPLKPDGQAVACYLQEIERNTEISRSLRTELHSHQIEFKLLYQQLDAAVQAMPEGKDSNAHDQQIWIDTVLSRLKSELEKHRHLTELELIPDRAGTMEGKKDETNYLSALKAQSRSAAMAVGALQLALRLRNSANIETPPPALLLTSPDLDAAKKKFQALCSWAQARGKQAESLQRTTAQVNQRIEQLQAAHKKLSGTVNSLQSNDDGERTNQFCTTLSVAAQLCDIIAAIPEMKDFANPPPAPNSEQKEHDTPAGLDFVGCGGGMFW